MSNLLERLEKRLEELRANPNEETKEELIEVRCVLLTIETLIKAELTINDNTLDSVLAAKEAYYSEGEYKYQEFYDSFLYPLEFLLTKADKYATVDEINECIKEELELKK